MISVKNLYLRYVREYYALYDINLEISQGESVALIGAEDSGKTSLLRVMTKLEKPTKGNIYINNRPLKKVNFKNDLSVGYIPATPVFMEKKTVYENLKYVLTTRKLPPQEVENKINDAIIEYSLEKIRDEKVCNLSLTEKFILSFIRLTFRELDLLIIDNIFDKLDEVYVEIIQDLVKKLRGKDTTLILATTQEKIANLFCKRKVYFKNGVIVTPEEFVAEEQA
jgi:ABC-type multidrug transport system ATPase subunit